MEWSTFLCSQQAYLIVWLVVLIAFVVIELITVGLTSIWFAAGALVALLVAALGANIGIQLLVFFAVSLLLLYATKSWARKYINGRVQKTNSDRLVGETIKIAERVSNIDQTGMAVVLGQEWTVRAVDDKAIIEAGEFAKVVSISGVKLLVERKKED